MPLYVLDASNEVLAVRYDERVVGNENVPTVIFKDDTPGLQAQQLDVTALERTIGGLDNALRLICAFDQVENRDSDLGIGMTTAIVALINLGRELKS